MPGDADLLEAFRQQLPGARVFRQDDLLVAEFTTADGRKWLTADEFDCLRRGDFGWLVNDFRFAMQRTERQCQPPK